MFLAAAFGFVKPESLIALRVQYGLDALGFLYLALALFVATVLLCLRAMWFKNIPTSGLSLESQEMSTQFLLHLPVDDLDDEMMAAYRDNKIEIWKSTTTERLSANVERARLVHWAQRTLAGGIIVSALSLGLLGYAVRNAVPSKQETTMPEKTVTPENNPAASAPKIYKFGSGKPKEMTREAVLKELKDRAFIAEQVRHVPRSKLG